MLTQELPDELVTQDAATQIRKLAEFINDPLTNGFSACTCKQHLYLLKCLIEDIYKDLPDFPQQEKEWEQTRLMEILTHDQSNSGHPRS